MDTRRPPCRNSGAGFSPRGTSVPLVAGAPRFIPAVINALAICEGSREAHAAVAMDTRRPPCRNSGAGFSPRGTSVPLVAGAPYFIPAVINALAICEGSRELMNNTLALGHAAVAMDTRRPPCALLSITTNPIRPGSS
jgi:hypothetical protein